MDNQHKYHIGRLLPSSSNVEGDFFIITSELELPIFHIDHFSTRGHKLFSQNDGHLKINFKIQNDKAIQKDKVINFYHHIK